MKSKFKYLSLYSLKKKINTKWFKVVNILLALLIIFIVNMDAVIRFFGGDFDTKETIYVVDNTGSFPTFSTYFDTFAETLELDQYELILDQNAMSKKENLEDEIIVVISSSSREYLTGEIISFDTVSRTTYEVLVNSMNALKSEIVLQKSGLTKEEIASLTSPASITETVLNEDATNNSTKELVSTIVTTILIIPFFILIVTMVQMIGAEINDEKTSKGMEIIISSVPAKTHFLSKVLAALSYVLIQGGLIFLYAFVGVVIRALYTTGSGATETTGFLTDTIGMVRDAGIFNLLQKGSIVLVILFVVSFIAYAVVSATLASMTTNNEDFQQLQSPLMIMMMVGYYVALMAVAFDGAVFIHVLAYIPLLSVMIAPTLYLMGEMSLLSLTCSTIVTCITTFFLFKYGLRIYKVGILNYSSSKLWKKMFQSLKNKN